MDNKERDKIMESMSENWKELSSQFFEMFHDHDCEWFPEGASTLDKQHISQVGTSGGHTDKGNNCI